jgi:hypothetical protein
LYTSWNSFPMPGISMSGNRMRIRYTLIGDGTVSLHGFSLCKGAGELGAENQAPGHLQSTLFSWKY